MRKLNDIDMLLICGVN